MDEDQNGPAPVDEAQHGPVGAAELRARPAGDYRALLVSAEKLLDDVDTALAALDAGSYGACRVCGAAIDASELATDPLAPTCAAHRRPGALVHGT